MTLDREIIRWIVGKEVKVTTQGDIYGRKWDTESYESVTDSVLKREYHKNLIYQAIEEGCTSVRAIREKVGLELQWISYLIADMEKTSMVGFMGMKDREPVFGTL